MNDIDKKIYTKTYLLLDRGCKTRAIKNKIRDYYGVSIKESNIMKWFPGVKKNHNELPDYLKRVALNLYVNWPNTDKVVEYLEKYHNHKFTKQALADLANRNGLKKKTHVTKLSQSSYSEVKIMAEMYISGKDAKEIASKFGYKTTKSVFDKITYFIGEDFSYFEEENRRRKSYSDFSMKKIDSKEKAYYLGLMLTDGYMYEKNNLADLTIIDEDAIQYLSEYINCNYEEILRPNVKPMYRIKLYGAKLFSELVDKSVVPRKSKTLKGPKLDREELIFLSDILRGVIDGDGWVRKDGKEFFICSASKDFLLWCKRALVYLGMSNLTIKKRLIKGYSPIYEIRTGRKENILILQEIYDEKYGMARKRKRVKVGCSETIIETR